MSKKIKVSKEFVLEAHKQACSEWKKRIENELPELLEKKFKEGKWYIGDGVLVCCTESEKCNTGVIYGYGVRFCDDGSHIWANNNCFVANRDNMREATKEEVETALIKEAKRRGFKEGVKFKHSGWGDVVSTVKNGVFFYTGNNETHLIDNSNEAGNYIFYEGKWAEIIEEPITEITLEEIAKLKGVPVDKIRIKE